MNEDFHISGTVADECELFERIRGGDEQAFTLVYERYHGMLYSLALRMIKQTGAAEDAVQYVFVRLWELRGGLSVTVSLRNYLYTMTKNYLLNYIRHNGRVLEQSYVIAQLRQQQDDTLAQYIESRDSDRRLGEAIDRLPRQQRAVIMMKRDGCSNREIAEKLHVSINTVKTHYADGLRSLRLSIGPIIKMITLLVMIRSL